LPTASGRLKRIPEKSNVVALMGSVAFDPLLAAQPGAFLTGRPPAHSLVFGTGQHHCIGAKNSWPIAPTLMTEMALRLFALPGLRRARGRKGTLRSSGSWPASFELEYDPDPVRGTP
jgi:cytochrome P450